MSGTVRDEAAPPPAQQASNDVQTQALQPDEFYLDGPYMVFTEAYHLRRGYCCNSDCRHCPYK